jgi:hypothetical protein
LRRALTPAAAALLACHCCSSRLHARRGGIEASGAAFDERARVYVATGDETDARGLIEPGESLSE